jgi:hypothetical protein
VSVPVVDLVEVEPGVWGLPARPVVGPFLGVDHGAERDQHATVLLRVAPDGTLNIVDEWATPHRRTQEPREDTDDAEAG